LFDWTKFCKEEEEANTKLDSVLLAWTSVKKKSLFSGDPKPDIFNHFSILKIWTARKNSLLFCRYTYDGDGVVTRNGTGVGQGLTSVAGTLARELRLLEYRLVPIGVTRRKDFETSPK
jgi:hypothetical protein